MNWEERQKMLAKEKLKLEKVGEIKITKEDEIRGLNGLINCMRGFEHRSEEELKEIYDEEYEKINKKYNNDIQ